MSRRQNMNQDLGSLYDRIGRQAGLAILLRHFYADVRQHHLIGPIFNQRISDWSAHLVKINDFWARILGGPSTYSGQMPAKHFNLRLQPLHFRTWLDLWDFNCRRYLQPQEAREMIQIAQEIGGRLSSIVAGHETSGCENAEAPITGVSWLKART
jgi:hemoglobin